MFEQPTKGDIDRALSTLMHEARHRLASRSNEIKGEAAKAGALQSSRLIVTVADAADKIHVDAMQQATSILREFLPRMNVTPLKVTEWARPHLENLGNSLLALIPASGHQNEHKRIVAQYQAQFGQRLTGALRDVEIGYAKGAGFTGAVSEDQWVRAADAVAMLKPILTDYAAKLRLCERAHGGLIRARAEQFQRGEQMFQNHEIPKEFWWAEGHEALQQDWAVGDFSTWIDQRIQLKAFGVTFARADIEKLLPSQAAAKEKPAAHTAEDDEIISKLDAVVPSAALSYTQAVLDLSEENRVSFRGPALEFREALREILDHLAPDGEVSAASGYVQEKDRSGPTMRQKVRFIMKKRGERSSSETPEQAVTAFEEAIASLTRAVYERSSKATHVAGERVAVVQIRRYVVAIFQDIL